MKNFLKLLFIVVMLFVVSCSEPPKKVSGVIAKFEAEGTAPERIGRGPKIEFSDGRIFLLSIMPNRSVDVGSEIDIFYKGRTGRYLIIDSVVVIKPAPVTSQITKENLSPDGKEEVSKNTAGFAYLSSQDFKTLADFIELKGSKVTKSDCQFVYIDKNGNRHALISIRRNAEHRADPLSPITQISVWVNGKNASPDKIFYSYIITPDGISWSDDASDKNVVETVNTLLKIAQKK